MAERGILFSAPMVRALLAGTKTQTRRPVKSRRDPNIGCDLSPGEIAGDPMREAMCPYGFAGDRLWVREACRAHEQPDGLDGVQFLADMAFQPIADTEQAADEWVKLNHYEKRGRGHVVPAIHMPRWASRITLEIVEVRVERLQDISEADAQAEGAARTGTEYRDACGERVLPLGTYRHGYRLLWESINGADSWAANPWVWVVCFRRV